VRLPIDYVAGLYDGDGSFTATVQRHPTVPSGFQLVAEVNLTLARYDSTVFRDVVETFPWLHFTVHENKLGMCMLRIRGEEDVYWFLRQVMPHLRIFTNVKRAGILYEIVSFILEHRRGMHYGSDMHFNHLARLVAEMRRYSKRVPRIKRNIESEKDINKLRDEGLSYTPPPLTVEYVAGLFDAEGYVGLVKRRHPRALMGIQVYPIVNINLAIYDSAVLFKLKEEFKHLNPQVKFREANNTAYFQITGISNVKRFLETIYPHLRLPSKRSRAEIVLEAIEFMERGEHKTAVGREKLLALVERLESLSKRRRPTNEA
jgi:hypothetical protein